MESISGLLPGSCGRRALAAERSWIVIGVACAAFACGGEDGNTPDVPDETMASIGFNVGNTEAFGSVTIDVETPDAIHEDLVWCSRCPG